MKEYEVIWEIFNKCPRNQMRDVFVEDGTLVFDIQTSQIRQRCSFTEI